MFLQSVYIKRLYKIFTGCRFEFVVSFARKVCSIINAQSYLLIKGGSEIVRLKKAAEKLLVLSCDIYFTEDMFQQDSLVIFNSNNITETELQHKHFHT